MSEIDPVVVAKGLSEAQRRAVLWLGQDGIPIRASRRTFSAIAAFNLVGPGLVKLTTRIPPGERDYRDHYSLTPLGHRVCQILEKSHD